MSTADPLADPPPAPLTASGLKHRDTVAHALARALVRHGVTHVFGQSLPSMLHLAAEEIGIRQVAYRTENAGGCMADGYARISRRPGVVTAQNGPAATLLVPPLAEALKASVPVIALVQDVNRDQADRNAFQDFDHLALFAPCTKWVRRVTHAVRLEDYVDQAFAIACSGRPGPVALLLPADLLLEPAAPGGRTARLGFFPLDRTTADPGAVREAAEAILAAERPVVVAGGGIHLSDAAEELAALQEAAHLPVATTVMGKGAVSEEHPLSLGVVGSSMGPGAASRHQRAIVADADLVVLVGNRTNQNGTDSWTLFPRGARFIHLDVDPVEIGRSYEATRLLGDARATLRAIGDALANRDMAKRRAARPALERRIAAARARAWEDGAPVRRSGASPMRPERVMEELSRAMPAGSVVVADASYSSIWITNNIPARQVGQRFLTPRGLAGLGWGFPMALGAKLAAGGADVFCVVGDGGFGHVWSELETARRMGIKVTLVVLNNGILGFQKHAENVKFGAHTSAVHFHPVNHAAIAGAAGCLGIRVSRPDDLAEAFRAAAAHPHTALLDVETDPDAFPPITSFTPG